MFLLQGVCSIYNFDNPVGSCIQSSMQLFGTDFGSQSQQLAVLTAINIVGCLVAIVPSHNPSRE